MADIRLGAAGLIYRDSKDGPLLLLGRRGGEPNKGMFVFSGGGVEEGETLDEALRREIMEETGLSIKTKKGTWKNPYIIEIIGKDKHRVIMVGEAVAEAGEPRTKDKSDLYDIGFFSAKDLQHMLPELSPVIIPILKDTRWII